MFFVLYSTRQTNIPLKKLPRKLQTTRSASYLEGKETME